jgi:hypothetical protein
VAIAVALGAGLGVFAVLGARTATLRRVAVSSTRFDAVGSAPEVSPTQPALSSAPVPTWPAAPSAPTAPAWPAARTAVVTPPAPYSIQVRGEAALRRLSYPYQQLGYTVTFLPGVSGYFGRGFHEQRRIEIYVRSGESDEALAHVVAHEIGHAIDWMYHTPSRDHEWLQLRGVDPSTEWARARSARTLAPRRVTSPRASRSGSSAIPTSAARLLHGRRRPSFNSSPTSSTRELAQGARLTVAA